MVFVAETEHERDLAGYVCVMWTSGYDPFRVAGIPEIMDFNVLPSHRRRGVGTALLDTAEALIAERATAAGLGCGLYADYGPALLLYLKRGYLPDGRGVVYDGQHVPPGGAVRLDDSAEMMLTKPLQ